MASDAGITLAVIFFTRILGRVQFQQDTKLMFYFHLYSTIVIQKSQTIKADK
ncbi:hypothetical protein [Streptococcus pantholopis]|uniref:hypothetical protein n=1 Tax=Streptococcus pantholopis TaxID=1811193 RepID=UPI000B2E4458|nr:hypothetical protein [Streptococcus pantholopis]